MGEIPNVREAYPLGNTSMDWFRGINETLDSEMEGFESKDVAYVGGTVYGAAHQGEYPESDVTVVESNPYAAALQSLAVEKMIETGEPDEAREAVFLKPLKENRESIEYYPNGFWMPEEQVKEVVETQEEFIRTDDRFPDSMVEGLNGFMNSFYGQHEEANHSDRELRSVDLAFTNDDTYLGLPEELEELEHPSIVTEPMESTQLSDRDILYTNNVIDWFDETGQFVDSVTEIGSDEGFYLSTYTTGIHNSFENPEELADTVRDQTEREVEVVPTSASGKVHQVTLGEPTEGEPVHETEDIQGGENGALLKIE